MVTTRSKSKTNKKPLLQKLNRHKNTKMPANTLRKDKASQKPTSSESDEEKPASFPQFSKLPADARQEIWSVAASTPASTPGVCIYTCQYAVENMDAPKPPLLVHERVNPALLATSTEAHDIALRSTPAIRQYDPAIDILFIPDRGSFSHFCCTGCTGNAPGAKKKHGFDAASVKHLAIALNLVDSGLGFIYALKFLTGLETLSVVYPASEGRVRYLGEWSLPQDAHEKPLMLRKLKAPSEMDRITVWADYIYSTWHSDLHMQWSHTGTEHLRSVKRTIDRDCQGMPEIKHWPLWDDKRKQMKIRYDARVLEVVSDPQRRRFCDQDGQGNDEDGTMEVDGDENEQEEEKQVVSRAKKRKTAKSRKCNGEQRL